MTTHPLVEILYSDGCPNHQPVLVLVKSICVELGLSPEIRLVNVPDQEAARRLRFLGSPTVRVGGHDIDPHTEERSDYALSCRVFRTEAGFVGQPPESWLREALLREVNGASQSTPREETVVRVLRAADIPPDRCRAERARRLTGAERDLYHWILKAFASGEPPTPTETRAEAERLGLDPAAALHALAREDLVHADERGEIVVAYPFSARPRGHRVLIDGKQWVEAMCAIDALGIAPMLNLTIEVASRDPMVGDEISVHLAADGQVVWEPATAVALAGSACHQGPSFRGCCDVLNFFASMESAERYLREHSEVAGFPIVIPDAVDAGRAVFGDIFELRSSPPPAP